jgi:hypothetical protein
MFYHADSENFAEVLGATDDIQSEWRDAKEKFRKCSICERRVLNAHCPVRKIKVCLCELQIEKLNQPYVATCDICPDCFKSNPVIDDVREIDSFEACSDEPIDPVNAIVHPSLRNFYEETQKRVSRFHNTPIVCQRLQSFDRQSVSIYIATSDGYLFWGVIDSERMITRMKATWHFDGDYGNICELPTGHWMCCDNIDALTSYTYLFLANPVSEGSKKFSTICCFTDESLANERRPDLIQPFIKLDWVDDAIVRDAIKKGTHHPESEPCEKCNWHFIPPRYGCPLRCYCADLDFENEQREEAFYED